MVVVVIIACCDKIIDACMVNLFSLAIYYYETWQKASVLYIYFIFVYIFIFLYVVRGQKNCLLNFSNGKD